MSRLLFRAAAALACVLATAGCAGFGASEAAAPQGATGTANPAGNTGDAYAALAGKLPSNLDGEIRRVQLLRASGDFADATRSVSQLMLVAPDDPRVVGEYGKVLAQQGRTDDALAFLGRAIELQPDNWTFYSALGVAYDQRGDRAKSADAYKHALALKPEEPTVLNNYAMSRMLAGDLDTADRFLRQAAVHGGDYPKIANNIEMIDEMRAKKNPSSVHPENRMVPAAIVAKSVQPQPPEPRVLQPGQPRDPTKRAAPRVVMAKVPYDPLAGKVYGSHKTAAPHRLAATSSKAFTKPASQTVAKAEAKAKPQEKSSPPALRTAADIY